MSLSLLEEHIETGNIAVIDAMLQANPALCQENTSHDISPLLLACYYQKLQIVEVILKHTQEISLYEAAAAGLVDIVQDFLEEYPESINDYSTNGFTALALAVHFGHYDIVRYLILKDADVNLPSNNGYNVFPLYSSVAANFEEISKMLIEAGANVNIAQNNGITPLHVAAQNANIELIILLLENGASVSAKNSEGKTPADFAIEKGNIAIGEILV